MVAPGVLAKLRDSCAWLVTTERAKPAMAIANDLIGFMILVGWLIIPWIGIHLDGWFERLDDSFRWWRVESTTVSDWLLLIIFLRGPA
jgi:purine-cytosine permease-like protein